LTRPPFETGALLAKQPKPPSGGFFMKKVKRKDDVGPGGDFKATKVRFHAGPKNESLEEPLEKVLADTAPHSGIIKTVMGTELPDPNRDRANKEKLKMKESVSLKTFKEKYEENSLY